MAPSMNLVPLRRASEMIRGARIEKLLLGLALDGRRLVITTDRVDADTGQTTYLVVEGAERVELVHGVLTVMGADDDNG